jgi:hypothetical protein
MGEGPITGDRIARQRQVVHACFICLVWGGQSFGRSVDQSASQSGIHPLGWRYRCAGSAVCDLVDVDNIERTSGEIRRVFEPN